MEAEKFPVDLFCRSIVSFLNTLEYDDNNITHEERSENFRYIHCKTVEYFQQPLPRDILKNINPTQIFKATLTGAYFVVCCWPYLLRNVQVDVSIYLSILAVVDDQIGTNTSLQTNPIWDEIMGGKDSQHPFWILLNAHLPSLLNHYGNFCGLNIIRATLDYFQGCWIEEHEFQGYPGSDCYPLFLRRLNGVGGAVGGTLFPANEFDEQTHFKDLSVAMAHIDGPLTFINDLFSYYKEFDEGEINLVSSWCTVDGIDKHQALERLTESTTHACTQILNVFKDKDPKVLATIRAFVHGYVTWHFCDLRYRINEIYERAEGPAGEEFRQYYEKAESVGKMTWEIFDLPQSHL